MTTTRRKEQAFKAMTLRPTPSQSQDIENLMLETSQKTGAGALLVAAAEYPKVCRNRNKLAQELLAVSNELETLKSLVRQQAGLAEEIAALAGRK